MRLQLSYNNCLQGIEYNQLLDLIFQCLDYMFLLHKELGLMIQLGNNNLRGKYFLLKLNLLVLKSLHHQNNNILQYMIQLEQLNCLRYSIDQVDMLSL